jgi:diguanylate cyclase (GGDEF)-like protein
LCEFAKILSKNIRKDKDWIARYGGEEFILFLVNVDNKTAKEIAERIRIAIMNKSFDFHGQVIKLTCSFGVHTVNSFKTIPSTLEILDAVDKRLYRAKSMGRNMVVT